MNKVYLHTNYFKSVTVAVSRFSVSLEEELLEALDNFVLENKFSNRSQALRALIEKNLVEKKWQCNNIVAGAIVLVHSNTKLEIITKLSELQSKYADIILSSQRFYLESDSCIEIVAVKGVAHKLTELSDLLLGIKGIAHGKLIMSKVN
jgi:CopG family nickel-responsive transcriptional regulator